MKEFFAKMEQIAYDTTPSEKDYTDWKSDINKNRN